MSAAPMIISAFEAIEPGIFSNICILLGTTMNDKASAVYIHSFCLDVLYSFKCLSCQIYSTSKSQELYHQKAPQQASTYQKLNL